jgi:hypothetical protein
MAMNSIECSGHDAMDRQGSGGTSLLLLRSFHDPQHSTFVVDCVDVYTK